MLNALVFAAGTAFFLWVSRRSLLRPASHGFWRFLAWECMLALVLVNLPHWEREPTSPAQLASWALLLISPALAICGVVLLNRRGRPDTQRTEAELLGFERTTTLVTSGIYRYIRHPMYAALMYLTWGAWLKDVSAASTVLAAAATLFLLLTALRDEAECLAHFGARYADYMRQSKRFVPFVF